MVRVVRRSGICGSSSSDAGGATGFGAVGRAIVEGAKKCGGTVGLDVSQLAFWGSCAYI